MSDCVVQYKISKVGWRALVVEEVKIFIDCQIMIFSDRGGCMSCSLLVESVKNWRGYEGQSLQIDAKGTNYDS